MSQFAHGISSLEFTSSSVLASPVWLLGSYYANPDTDVEAYESHFHSILWYTYRRDFLPMEPYDYTSDAGWGCMLRSAQMMLSGAFQRVLLGKDWRVPTFTTSEALPSAYISLLQWVLDTPDINSLYSIHHLVKIGYQYDQLPGEWYGPTTASLVLRDLVNLHCREHQGPLAMYVPQEGVVYSEDVYQLVISMEEQSSLIEGNDYDPLLHVPTITTSMTWNRSILILLPLRLGLDVLNTCYLSAIQQFFTFPQSIGIIGGKKGHSVYFVGCQDEKLHLLDPHHVQPTTEYNTSFPTVTHLSTIHAPKPLIMNMDSIDPSMAFGFVCTSQEEYIDFYNRVETMQKELGMMNCPFSVATQRPTYTNEMVDVEEMEERTSSEREEEEEEEEYVLI